MLTFSSSKSSAYKLVGWVLLVSACFLFLHSFFSKDEPTQEQQTQEKVQGSMHVLYYFVFLLSGCSIPRSYD
jgi:hypothetical protein